MIIKKKERICVGELVFGKAEIIVYEIKGKNKGPRVGIICMSHGTEYIGAKIIDKLYEELNPNEVSGSIIAIPITNPFATALKNNNTPAGLGEVYSSMSLNSQYPGDLRGDLTQQLAKKIFDLIKDVNYLIDIHSGTVIGEIYPQVRVKIDKDIKNEVIKASRKLAYSSGLDIIVETSSSDISRIPNRLLSTQAMIHGIPAVTLELFGGCVIKEHVDFGLSTVYNILKSINSLKGQSKKKKQRRYTKLTKLYSPGAGILDFKKELGLEIRKGEAYAVVKDLLTGKTYELIAPTNGILGFKVHFGIVNKGDYIGEFLS